MKNVLENIAKKEIDVKINEIQKKFNLDEARKEAKAITIEGRSERFRQYFGGVFTKAAENIGLPKKTIEKWLKEVVQVEEEVLRGQRTEILFDTKFVQMDQSLRFNFNARKHFMHLCLLRNSIALNGNALGLENALTKEELTNMRTAHTFLSKFIDSVNDRICEDERRLQTRYLEDHQFVVKQVESERYKKEKEEIDKDSVTMTADLFNNIFHFATKACDQCDKSIMFCEEKYMECDLFVAMRGMDINPNFLNDNYCAYRPWNKETQEVE